MLEKKLPRRGWRSLRPPDMGDGGRYRRRGRGKAARSISALPTALVHHFGSKDELVVAALRRAAEIQQGVEGRWRRQVPHLSMVELQRRWWRWINRSPEHLALVRLGLEAATLDATVTTSLRLIPGTSPVEYQPARAASATARPVRV